MAVVQTGWSPDGNWFWDGARWNDAISQDGKWRFDGNNWQPFGGQRTPMPVQALHPAAPPPPPAPPSPAPIQAAVAAMPSWVDPSEIERIEREKRERELAAAQAPPPIAPELDWRNVGERMQYGDYSHNRTYASWQVGGTSILIYILLLWLCGPLSVIFVWLTGWRLVSKIITTCISAFGLIVAILLVIAAQFVPSTG